MEAYDPAAARAVWARVTAGQPGAAQTEDAAALYALAAQMRMDYRELARRASGSAQTLLRTFAREAEAAAHRLAALHYARTGARPPAFTPASAPAGALLPALRAQYLRETEVAARFARAAGSDGAARGLLGCLAAQCERRGEALLGLIGAQLNES